MYNSLKNICNKQINFANMQIKYKRDIEYYKGIIDANIQILKQINKNEEYIINKQKNKRNFLEEIIYMNKRK